MSGSRQRHQGRLSSTREPPRRVPCDKYHHLSVVAAVNVLFLYKAMQLNAKSVEGHILVVR